MKTGVVVMEKVKKREKISITGRKIERFGIEVNEFDYLTALSNRRLSSQNLGISVKLHWSIDRITIVGETKLWDYVDENGNPKVCYFADVFEHLKSKGFAEPVSRGWVLKDKYGENIAYAEELQYQVGKARIDFNPNKLGACLDSDLKTFFKNLFVNPHFSRADVACDIIDIPDEYISQYTIVSDVKSILYHDRAGKLETAYWGSRSSERQVRMYNKYVEQTKKGKAIHKDITSWWRLEMQLRREKASNWYQIVEDSLSEFCSPFFFPLSFSATDRVMLTGLFADNSLWADISKNSKTKYKKLQKELAKEDALTVALKETFREESNRLKDELDTWLLGLDVTS